MDRYGRFFLSIATALLLVFSLSANVGYPLGSLTSAPAVAGCATSTPAGGVYSVTLCFTAPTNGSVVSTAVTVSASASVTGTSPGVQRLVFYINGAYLLTDYQSPYTFSLPTTKWMDGAYNLQVEALMRDGYTTVNQASLALTFDNGITTPPVNTLSFTPSTGTTPAAGSPFIVAAAGDGASGENSAANVTNLIASINPNLFLYLGDVYENGSVSEFYNWYGHNGTNFSKFLAITDPTIGNHEYTDGAAPGYFDYWNNIPDYYSFNAGGWHFVSLNSSVSVIGASKASAQYAWLAQDLADNITTCTIVFYHEPLFNIGPEGEDKGIANVWALMAQDGVSLVLNGHDHDYQRWTPLDGSGQPSATGITEFIAGGGGHALQTISRSDPQVAFSDDLNPQAFGALELALTPQGATFNYISSSGVTLDSGSIPCSKPGLDTQPPSVPTGLTFNAAGTGQVKLTWQASTDNIRVSGYTIYRDGTPIATVPASTLSYVDNTVLPFSPYSYSVDAFDLAGNHSLPTTPMQVITLADPSRLIFLPVIIANP